MAGRRPKPTKLKIVEGNLGKRPLPKDEPEFEPAVAPEPPDHLGAVAAKHWRTLAGELHLLGLGGDEICRLVKQHHPDLPVVLIGDADENELRAVARRCGADAHHPKDAGDAALLRVCRLHAPREPPMGARGTGATT